MKQLLFTVSVLLCVATACATEGPVNQNAPGPFGFESVLFGTTFDNANAYIQAKFSDDDIMTKTDSVKKKRTILIENYDVSGKNSFLIDVILSFDRNDVFFKCELEGPNRISDPKLLVGDESYLLDMLKNKYGEKLQHQTLGGRRFYRWSLGTAQVILTTIQGKEFQFAKVFISDVSLSTTQDEYEKAEKEKTKGTAPGKI